MRLGTDDPAGSGRRSDRLVGALDWTIILLCLGLAVLLLVGGLLPARERKRRLLENNDALADEVLRLKRDSRERIERIRDLEFDPHTIERLLRERGALGEGEVPLEPVRPAPGKKTLPEPQGTRR
ncbi:MAG: hypothetical protein JXQ29_09110 [Planctomycetes bacterium]|nr:hypothetical protein [Planctomycetota bacterium]